ncbi:hypothetical protein [Tsukamurella sp. 1534]|uniref:hypothetical protein n=1 Tax=Tsukamurella sp. 1534 TaxID=1151061 RepID=UPI0002FB7EAE|nr:hypothetical protein [Tsukamurella sp. 1534]
MIARRFALAVTLAAAAMTVPALAQAAPVKPARALLDQFEFPPGSIGHVAGNASPRVGDGESNAPRCAALSRDLDRRLSSVTSAEARAGIGGTALLVYILDRPLSGPIAGTVLTCGAQYLGPKPVADTAIPSDLRGRNPAVVRTGTTDLQAWVDVRGVTVSVNVISTDRTPVDRNLVWRLLRDQIAKVEKQP